MLMNAGKFHLLSLIYTRDAAKLEYFLADVSNLERLRRRALRLGGWKLLDPLEKGILNTVCRILNRIRSRLLLDVIIRIIVKISDYLLSRFEKNLIENYYRLKELLNSGKLSINRASSNIDIQEYLLTQAWRLAVSQEIGMDVMVTG